MAATYNPHDKVWYGSSAERAADTTIVSSATAKFYEYDTGNVYITNGTAWYLI
jgi:hypothetical protein